jgi:hypothetical protein
MKYGNEVTPLVLLKHGRESLTTWTLGIRMPQKANANRKAIWIS